MRLPIVAACLLLSTGIPGAASAKALYGDKLEYVVKADHGNVVLIISNKSPANRIDLSAVSIVLPKHDGQASKEVNVFNSTSGQAISSQTEIKLGTVAEFTKLIPPSASFVHYLRVIPSEKPGCKNIGPGNYQCISLGFDLKIKMVYSNGVVQDGLTEVYLEYVK